MIAPATVDGSKIAPPAALGPCTIAALSNHHRRELAARLATLIAVAVGSIGAATGAAKAGVGRLVHRVSL